METIKRKFGNYTPDHFKSYITNENELENLQKWLDSKTNLNLDIFNQPIGYRFDIRIELNSALDRIFVFDRLDGDSVEITDWDSF